MKKKEEILLEKLNMKDYKVEFEEILEQKNFSNDVKNFLLSLLYKIENSYEDYKLVKVISLTKQQFIEEYINIIKVECNYIELVKPMSKDIELLESIKCKCIAQKDKGKIVSIYNYKTFLYALYVLNYKSCNFNNEILDLSMNEWLKVGSSIEKEEVIRDFDGWSWHMDSREICSLEYNAIYQSVNFLLDSITGDLQSSLEEKYGQTNSKYLYSLICKVVLLIYVTNNPKEKRKIISKEEKLRSELDKISNKTQYLEQIRSKKKTLEDEIRKIDGILNDVDKLKKSY
ncbi:MAG: hypothetical protein LBL91_06395, partial [Lachnospiraceae bacterium]|nr:hypothetical protein [Lachnospiraceae bacterium]